MLHTTAILPRRKLAVLARISVALARIAFPTRTARGPCLEWTRSSELPGAQPDAQGGTGWIRAFAVHDDGAGSALFAGGAFLALGAVPADLVARWNSSRRARQRRDTLRPGDLSRRGERVLQPDAVQRHERGRDPLVHA